MTVPVNVSTKEPYWIAVARLFLGLKEIPGPVDEAQIRAFHGSTAGGEAPDETPWCSSFACFCMERGGMISPRSKRALSWLEWGDTLTTPIVGAVAVFDHGGGKGHVGFVVGKTASKKLIVLGGNQSDSVKLSVYGYDKIAGFRWPSLPVLTVAEIAGESTR